MDQNKRNSSKFEKGCPKGRSPLMELNVTRNLDDTFVPSTPHRRPTFLDDTVQMEGTILSPEIAVEIDSSSSDSQFFSSLDTTVLLSGTKSVKENTRPRYSILQSFDPLLETKSEKYDESHAKNSQCVKKEFYSQVDDHGIDSNKLELITETSEDFDNKPVLIESAAKDISVEQKKSVNSSEFNLQVEQLKIILNNSEEEYCDQNFTLTNNKNSSFEINTGNVNEDKNLNEIVADQLERKTEQLNNFETEPVFDQSGPIQNITLEKNIFPDSSEESKLNISIKFEKNTSFEIKVDATNVLSQDQELNSSTTEQQLSEEVANTNLNNSTILQAHSQQVNSSVTEQQLSEEVSANTLLENLSLQATASKEYSQEVNSSSTEQQLSEEVSENLSVQATALEKYSQEVNSSATEQQLSKEVSVNTLVENLSVQATALEKYSQEVNSSATEQQLSEEVSVNTLVENLSAQATALEKYSQEVNSSATEQQLSEEVSVNTLVKSLSVQATALEKYSQEINSSTTEQQLSEEVAVNTSDQNLSVKSVVLEADEIVSNETLEIKTDESIFFDSESVLDPTDNTSFAKEITEKDCNKEYPKQNISVKADKNISFDTKVNATTEISEDTEVNGIADIFNKLSLEQHRSEELPNLDQNLSVESKDKNESLNTETVEQFYSPSKILLHENISVKTVNNAEQILQKLRKHQEEVLNKTKDIICETLNDTTVKEKSQNLNEKLNSSDLPAEVNKSISFGIIENTSFTKPNVENQNIQQVIGENISFKTTNDNNISFEIKFEPERKQISQIEEKQEIIEEISNTEDKSISVEEKSSVVPHSQQENISEEVVQSSELNSEISSFEELDKSEREPTSLDADIVDSNEIKQNISLKSLLNTDSIKHMTEETSSQNTVLCDSTTVDKLSFEINSASTNAMGEVIDDFEKQLSIHKFDNKETLQSKENLNSDMADRLTMTESECERLKEQVATLKKELKSSRQKTSTLESEIVNHKRKEAELNNMLEEFVMKPAPTAQLKEKDEEIKQLKASEETLKNELNEVKQMVKQLENKLKELQQKEVKRTDDISTEEQKELQIKSIMEGYEKSISNLATENEFLKKELETSQMHLANIELAFSDVHQKYERSKQIVQGFKDNEESFRQDIAMNRDTIAKQEEKYETLKSHAMAQLEKSNLELANMRKQYESDISRLTAQLKRFEIKVVSLTESLQQKTKECEQLSAVCDEYIGRT